EIVYATIEPARADDKTLEGGDDLLRDRRPATYGLLTALRDQFPTYQQPATPERRVALAAVQCSARGPDDAGALDRALALAERAADGGAQVLVLPEAFLWAPGEIAADPAAAVERSHAAYDRFADLCARRAVHAALNLVEAREGGHANTVVLLGPSGQIGRYQQTHVCAADRGWATPGDAYPVFDTDIGRLGLMLGYDDFFPEVARLLALQGAEAILFPCAWRVPYEPRLLVVERAAENHVALVAACRTDAPVPEGSRILPLTRYPCEPHWTIRFPQAVTLAPGVEDVLVTPVDLGAAAVKLIAHRTDLVADRRPEFYGLLAATPAPVG
ncbi:MAG: carbon-nitrogen hydrolase family protein, partial [Gaiellales bacterium]